MAEQEQERYRIELQGKRNDEDEVVFVEVPIPSENLPYVADAPSEFILQKIIVRNTEPLNDKGNPVFE